MVRGGRIWRVALIPERLKNLCNLKHRQLLVPDEATDRVAHLMLFPDWLVKKVGKNVRVVVLHGTGIDDVGDCIGVLLLEYKFDFLVRGL